MLTISPVIHWMILSVTSRLQRVGERKRAIGSLCRTSMKKTGRSCSAVKLQKTWLHHINFGQTGFGAFDGERIIGFATVSHRIFGTAARYVQLVCFQISKEYRRQGIGRKLFSMVCEEARRLGADKLYISAHSSKESQAAYRALGCTPAEEINAELAAAEPFDIQMEYSL